MKIETKNNIQLKNTNISGLVDGTIYVTITKNNTMLTLTDTKGDVVT